MTVLTESAATFRPNGIVTLTTDFGLSGSYVGAMKGAVLSRYSSAKLIDITHHIPPQDVSEGARTLAAACVHYPPGTVHLVVVDPGVGTARRAVVAIAGGHAFVGPDNGVLCRALARLGDGHAFAIENTDLQALEVSHTFHGRDIFGPTAGALAGGFPLSKIGPGVRLMQAKSRTAVIHSASGAIEGTVESVDHFGNLLTNIPADELSTGSFVVCVGAHEVRTWVSSYGQSDESTLVALVSSESMVEVAVPNGNASKMTGLGVGAAVILVPRQ